MFNINIDTILNCSKNITGRFFPPSPFFSFTNGKSFRRLCALKECLFQKTLANVLRKFFESVKVSKRSKVFADTKISIVNMCVIAPHRDTQAQTKS